MNVSIVLESTQVGDVWSHEPQTRWLSINVRLDTLSLLGQSISKCDSKPIIPKLHLHVYHAQSSVWKTIPKVIIQKNFNFASKCNLELI